MSAPQVKAPTPTEGNETPLQKVQVLIEKKLRSIQKRKTRLESLKEQAITGKPLNADQLKAVAKMEDVVEMIEFFQEFSKNVSSIITDSQKAEKKAAKKAQLERQQQENDLVKTTIRTVLINSNLGESSDDQVAQLDEILKGLNIRSRSEETLTKQITETVQSVTSSGIFEKPTVTEPPPQPIAHQAPLRQPPQQQQNPSVNFIQPDSLTTGIDGDPAILSMIPPQPIIPTIPSQTFTNPSYAHAGYAAYPVNANMVAPLINATVPQIHQTSPLQEAVPNQSDAPNYEQQADYNTEQFRLSSSQDANFAGKNDESRGKRRGGGGYRGNRNGGQTNGYSRGGGAPREPREDRRDNRGYREGNNYNNSYGSNGGERGNYGGDKQRPPREPREPRDNNYQDRPPREPRGDGQRYERRGGFNAPRGGHGQGSRNNGYGQKGQHASQQATE